MNLIKKVFVTGILSLVISTSMSACSVQDSNLRVINTSTKTPIPQNLTSEVFNNICNDYIKNQVRAEETYEGKSFSMEGVINSITSGEVELYYAKSDMYPYYTINCRFKNDDDLKTLNVNDKITIVGTLDYIEGFESNWVGNYFTECKVVKVKHK